MHLLRYTVVECTVAGSPFSSHKSCSKCRPSAWIRFLCCVTTELVTLRNTAALLMLLAALRIRWSSISVCVYIYIYIYIYIYKSNFAQF